MSLAVSLILSALACFPRVSGDEPEVRSGRGQPNSFSPRERG